MSKNTSDKPAEISCTYKAHRKVKVVSKPNLSTPKNILFRAKKSCQSRGKMTSVLKCVFKKNKKLV